MSGSKPAPLKQLPLRMHHNASVVKDHEINRQFFEDVLGLPLVAAWCENFHSPEMGRDVEYCHTFFAIGDGGTIAFFQFRDPEMYTMCMPEIPAKIGRYQHISLIVTKEAQDEIAERLTKAGYSYRMTNHGYTSSLYCTSPDGLYLEFAYEPPHIAEIEKVRAEDPHGELARWMAGDTTLNNPWRDVDF